MMRFVNYGDLRANPFGPVNARYVCFQQRRNIVAVDPLSGELLWAQEDFPPGSEIFGDEQYLFVLPPGRDEASVYRAIDGQLLGRRKVHRPKSNPNIHNDGRGGWGSPALSLSDSGIDFWGRFVLTWEEADGKSHTADGTPTMGTSYPVPAALDSGRVLTLFDPWRQKAAWPSRNFAAGARVSVVGSEAVGVLEPGGRFVLLALADGRTIADVQLPVRPQFSLSDLIVTRLGDQYIVLANDDRVLGMGREDQVSQPPQGITFPVRRGRLYAFDSKGKLAWPAPVDVDHQYFLVSQPGRLPVLLFAAFRYPNYIAIGPSGQFDRMMQTSLLAVDRRNGRVVYDKVVRGPMAGMVLEIDGDPANKTVGIATSNGSVNLTFTDKPILDTARRGTGGKE
jgi:hypothetical protein